VLNDSTASQAMYVYFHGWMDKVHSGAEPYNVTSNFGNRKQVYLYRTYKQLQGNYSKNIIFHCILLDTSLNCMIYVLSICINIIRR